MNAIEVKDLTKAYDGFVLDRLSFALPEGCILGLVGENGAGKSTTIRLILDQIRKDGGSVLLFGRDNAQNIRLAKEDVGVVPDEIGLPECLTAKQVGRVMARTFKNWDDAAYTALLQRLAVPDGKPFKALSRGMKMKLGIAVALSHGAKLLLLDEPTSGLDPVARDAVVQLLTDFTRADDHSVLISSHIVGDLEKVCDYVAFLHKGRLLLFEEKDRLLAAYGLFCGTAEAVCALPRGAVQYKEEDPYGVRALVRRDALPDGADVRPVGLEELFLWTVKGLKQ